MSGNGHHGFARHASGLFVPDEVARPREVWTRDEWRVLERATTLLTARNILLYLRCALPACAEAPLERRRNPDGGLTLRCAHLDRVIPRRLR